MIESDNTEAIELADKMRRGNNNVCSVNLRMEEDGNNVCFFVHTRNTVGCGESRASLLDAIQKACVDWRYRHLTQPVMGQFFVVAYAKIAIKDFGGKPGVFNTAGFYQAVNAHDLGFKFDESLCRAILECHPRIVRLSGGAHWLLLPNESERFIPGDE